MHLRTALACLLLMPAAACDAAHDDEYRDAAAIHEVDDDVDHVNWDDVEDPSEAPRAHVNWEDVESIHTDGSAFQTSCDGRSEGESWVTPECFVCSCEDGGMATCWLAACTPDEDGRDPMCRDRRDGERWTDGCNEFWCEDGRMASTRRTCAPQM